MLNGTSLSLHEDGSWVENVLELASRFEEVVFRHVHRGGNCLTHMLASHACYDGSAVWCSSFPIWLTSVVLQDSPLDSPCGSLLL